MLTRILYFMLPITMLWLSGCSDGQSAAAAEQHEPRSSPQQPLRVSIIRLIAQPEAYDGEHVRLMGFYRAEFEGTSIYLHREDYEQGLYKNGLWVARDEPELSDRYVLIEGRSNAQMKGHMGLWSGSIEQITRLEPWPPAGNSQ